MVTVSGKIESGFVSKGDLVMIRPNNLIVEVLKVIVSETKETVSASSGENVKLILKNLNEDILIQQGFVLCSQKYPVSCQKKFEAIISLLELLPHKPVFSAGYSAVIHIHSAVEECSVIGLLEELDRKTLQSKKIKPLFIKSGCVVRVVLECKNDICVETFENLPQLGRFTLRDEGKTIGIGKIIALAPRKKSKINT